MFLMVHSDRGMILMITVPDLTCSLFAIALPILHFELSAVKHAQTCMKSHPEITKLAFCQLLNVENDDKLL